jgi:phosphate transport system substrate-binding protein
MKNKHAIWGAVIASVAILGGCNSNNAGTSRSNASGKLEAAQLRLDGSSTVAPIVSAVVEEYNAASDGSKITVAQAGTGAGMQKFLSNEVDICDASRPIEKEEIAKAAAAKIEFIELPIAFDGLSIIVNPKNTWATTLTVAELKKIWEPNSTVKNWSDVRAGFPNKPLKRYGPSTAHGTFEYFTEAIVGKKKQQTTDFQQCPEYNTLIQGVASDEGAIGYVGFAYYVQNKDQLSLVKVDDGTGAIAPSSETIANGTYKPLSRPLFIYVNKAALEKPGTVAFVKYLLTEGRKVIDETGYVQLPEEDYVAVIARAEKKETGSVFSEAKPGMKISDVLKTVSGK